MNLGNGGIAIMSVLMVIIGCLLTGILIPGKQFRDMVKERDYYRKASQECANAIAQANAQLAVLLRGGNTQGHG